MMKVILLLFLFFTPVIVAQNTLLNGMVSDPNGVAIADVKVITVSKNGNETTSKTDENGFYKIQLSNVVLLKFIGPSGFQNVEVKYCASSKKELTFDITMDVDPDGSGVMYSEFVCDKDFKNCKYISRLGKGTTKPKKLTFNCVRTKHK
ncbi:MAG: carboxypeptidase-like regulatory domain-containing protein [Pyrinomonadaceae bacterium]